MNQMPQTEVERLKGLMEEIKQGILSWKYDGPEFNAWKDRGKGSIRRFYRDSSTEKETLEEEFDRACFWRKVSESNLPSWERGPDWKPPATINQEHFVEALRRAHAKVSAILEDMRIKSTSVQPTTNSPRPRIFVAHGGHSHNRGHLELFLWRKGCHPVIVEEMPSLGMGPDAKVDYYMQESAFAVIFAEVERASSQDGKLYPRLNIVDEIARVRKTLGGKFIVLLEEGLNLPSNEAGAVVWESFGEGELQRALVAIQRELDAQGIVGLME